MLTLISNTSARRQDEERLVALNDILHPRGPIAVARSTWWKGVKEGRFPQPIYLGARLPRWRWSDIRRLMETGAMTTPGETGCTRSSSPR
jgi:predicted DNA-binding transcriptional regulator AlpA